jgi:hypothetical protein
MTISTMREITRATFNRLAAPLIGYRMCWSTTIAAELKHAGLE